MVTAIASIFAGLGLFFVGLQMLTENVKRLAGRRFRLAVTAWTEGHVFGFLWGVLLKAFTNSSTITTVILISLLQSGAITVVQALPVLIGQNVGGAALVYLASLDIKLFALFLIGTTGLLITSERASRLRTVAGALLGIGLLFLGLDLIQAGAAPVADVPWFRATLQRAADSYALAFFVGGLLTFLSQSTAAVSVLAITMTKADLLTINQTIMIIYGCHMGSSLTTGLLGLKLSGRPRQLAMYQTIFNVVGAAVLVPLFYIEVHEGTPLVRHFVTSLTDRVEWQMAHIYLLYNCVAGLILLPLLRPVARLLERLWPPTAVEEAAKFQYIYDSAIGDAETAIDLSIREQGRLISIFPQYLETLRDWSGKGSAQRKLKGLRESFVTVAGGVAEFLNVIGRTNPPPATYERLNRVIRDQSMIRFIEESVWALSQAIDEARLKPALQPFRESVIEAIHAVLLTAEDALCHTDEFSRTILQRLTADEGEAMQTLRKAYLDADDRLGPDEKVLFLRITNICERLAWLLHSFSVRR